MGYFRLFKHEVDVFRGAGGSIAYLIVADGATINAYRQGASSAEVKNMSGLTDTQLLVHDSGSLRSGDTVQLGTDDSQTATVVSVGDGSVNLTAAGTFNVTALHMRLVVQTEKPYIYKDIAGQVAYSGTRGECPPIGTTGNSEFYSTVEFMDLIVTGGGLASDQLITDHHGAMRWNVVTLEDFGGIESALVPGTFNNATVLEKVVDYALATGKKVVELGPGIYMSGAATALADMSGGLSFIGQGMHASQIQMTGSAVTFVLSGSTQDIEFKDLTLSRSSGTANVVSIASGVERTVLQNIAMVAAGSGVLDIGTNTIMENVHWSGSTTGALQCQGTGGRYRGLNSYVSSNPATAQIVVTSGTDLEFTSPSIGYSSASNGGEGLSVFSGAENIKVIGGSFTGGAGATSDSGIIVSGGEAVKFIGTLVRDSEVGFQLTGGEDTTLVGCAVVGTNKHGVEASGDGYIRIQAHSSSDIGADAADTYDHINIAGSADNKFVNGMTCGNFVRSSGIRARSGVYMTVGAGKNLSALDIHAVTADVIISVDNQKANTITDIYINHVVQAAGGVTSAHGAVGNLARTWTADETALNVADISYGTINTASAVGIASFTGGSPGQTVYIKNLGAGTQTWTDGANFKTTSAAPQAIVTGELIGFVYDGTTWRQITIEKS